MAWQLDTLVLPEDLQWSDEFDWSVVAQSMEYSVTGSLLIQSASKQTGRVVTLIGAEDRCWVSRTNIELLQSWADVAAKEMTLTFPDTSTHTVMFQYDGGNPVKTVSLVDGAPETGASWKPLLELKLIIID